jgi:hypothetical protein
LKPQEGEIWLGFGVLTEADRVLHLDNGSVADLSREESIEPFHACRMTTDNRCHLNDLALDEFDAVVLIEDPRL